MAVHCANTLRQGRQRDILCEHGFDRSDIGHAL